MEELRLETLFHVSNIRGGSDYTVGLFVRLESSGGILGAY